MKTKKVFSKFGLEISDVDIKSLDEKNLEKILDYLSSYGLVVFPNQLLSDKDLYHFSRRIGRLEESARKICLSPEFSEVSYLTNLRLENHNPLGFPGNHTDYWHSDQEFRKSPATLATLYCLIPSPEGGETSFASTSLSNVNLSEETISELNESEVLYIPAKTHDNATYKMVSHPAILTNPETLSQSVYISENTQGIVKNKTRSLALKEIVLNKILKPEKIYRHQWRMGDLILYDNTQLIHRRESFEGIRWLKATKIFAPEKKFAIPDGYYFDESLMKKTYHYESK